MAEPARADESTDQGTEAAAVSGDLLNTGEETAAPAETPAEETTEPAETPAEAETPAPVEGDLLATEKTGDEETKETTTGEDGDSEVPETYEFAMPEGFSLADDVRVQASTIFKEAKFTQAQAKVVTDLYIGLQQGQVETQAATVQAFDSSMRKQVVEDPEIGGDKLAQSVAFTKAAIQKLDGGPMIEFMKTLGIQNHYEIFKFIRRVGVLVSEDNGRDNVRGESSPGSEDDLMTKTRSFYEDTMGAS